jgi:hypothetical protein
MNQTVWTYSHGLELNSPRFTRPGDFFTYIVFICATIVVSQSLVLVRFFVIDASNVLPMSFNILPPCYYIFPKFNYAPRISARSVIFFLAEAVPKTEEDYPCSTHGSIIRNHKTEGPCAV